MTPEELVAALKNDPTLIDDLTQLIESRNSVGSSDAGSASIGPGTDNGVSLRDNPVSGSTSNGTAHDALTRHRAARLGPNTCQAIKKDGTQCTAERVGTGRWADLCKWHSLHAGAGRHVELATGEVLGSASTIERTPVRRKQGPFERCWFCGNPPTDSHPWWDEWHGIWGHYDIPNDDRDCPPLPDGWAQCAGCSYAQPPGKWEPFVPDLTLEEYLVAVAERGGKPLGEPEAWCVDEEACARRMRFFDGVVLGDV